MKLSVVVPVYKVEKTLVKCVDSILHQGVTDIEIILVDDGSPDKCPEICEALANKHSCVNVIHKKNGGLSSARNAGIKIAKGDYITFVDSDDFLEDNSYKALIEILEKHTEYDILEFPVMVFYGSSREHVLSFDNKEYYNANEYWLNCRAYAHAYAWNKIYRKSMFDDVKYPEGKVFEDAWTLPLLLKKAKCVATCNKGYYYYCDNSEGITNTAGGKQMKMLLDAHITALKTMNLPHGKELLRYYMSVVNTQIQTFRYEGNKVSLPEISIGKEIFSYLKENDISMSSKFKCIILKIFNLTTLCKLINTLKKQNNH